MGAVYVATDERFGSLVAIKETLCMDDTYRKAIEHEARLLNRLSHHALPKVSDHFLEEEVQFLVMEYIPGEDFGFMMDRDKRVFSFEEVLKWANQLLDALDFLHNQENPVIHRDIKPQNLKITSSGQIVLLDFGLAKGNPADGGFNTAPKSIFGYSRSYASLEQIQGTGTDPRSDLYSLAATLYHLLTGVPPEDALTRATSVLNQKADPLIPAHLIRPEIPKGFSGILQNAMDLNAGKRPQSAAEMREMVGDYSEFEHFAVSDNTVLPVAGEIFSQKTQILPSGTRQGNNGQTNVGTQLLPAVISKETALHDNGLKPAKRPFAILATIVLGGVAGAGMYFYDPSYFGAGANENSESDKISVAGVPVPNTSNIAVANTAVETTVPAEENAAARSTIDTTKKNASKATAKTGEKNRNTEADDPNYDEDTVYVGNVKMTDQRIETKDIIIDEKGIRPRVPVAPMVPPSFRNLTPAQRRRLRIIRQNQLPPDPAPSPRN